MNTKITEKHNMNVFRKIINSFSSKNSKEVNFFDYSNAVEYLDVVSSFWKEGYEGALFLPIGKYTDIAEKIAVDLFFSNNETYKCYASQLLGFIEDPKKHLFIYFYRTEKQYYKKLPEDDFKRYNSHAIIESLIMSTLIRFALGYESEKSSYRLGCDWIDFLYEVVYDAIDGYNWNTYEWALALLSFFFGKEERFKKIFAKYKEHIVRAEEDGIEVNRNLYDEILAGNFNSEIFVSLDNLVVEKIDVAKKIELNDREKHLIEDMIKFMQLNMTK